MKRIQWIDFCRSLAIFSVVVGHITMGLRNSPVIHTGYAFSLIQAYVYSFHIPLFFFISGFLYKKYLTWHSFGKNILKKFIVLGIPYVVFSAVMFALTNLSGGQARNVVKIQSLLSIWKQPIEYLWFLYVLFFIFVYIGLLQLIIKNDIYSSLLIILLAILASFLPNPSWILREVPIWSLIFLSGCLIKRIINTPYFKVLGIFSGLIYVLYLCLLPNILGGKTINYTRISLIQLIVLLSAALFITFIIKNTFRENKITNFISKYGPITLVIYLVHMPLGSITRIALIHIGLLNPEVHLIVGVLISFFGSVIVEWFVDKVKPLDFIFYPQRYLNL